MNLSIFTLASCMLTVKCWLRPWLGASLPRQGASRRFLRKNSSFAISGKLSTAGQAHEVKFSRIRKTGEADTTRKDIVILNKSLEQQRQSRHDVHNVAPGKKLPKLALEGRKKKTLHKPHGVQNWRERIATFEQLDYESDVYSPISPNRGRRLIAYQCFRFETRLWHELLVFRRRVYGNEGAKKIWWKFRGVPELETIDIYSVEALWKGFVELGLEDLKILRGLIDYVATIYAVRGSVPPDDQSFYVTVMSRVLKQDPGAAIQVHKCLEFLRFSRDQLVDLAEDLGHYEAGTQVLQFLSKDVVSFDKIYDIILPRLCKRGLYEAAYLWHVFLIQRSDLPSSQDTTLPLIEFLRASRGENAAGKLKSEMVEKMTEGGVPAHKPSHGPNGVLQVQQKVKIQPLTEVLDTKNRALGKKFSDRFCARLFATKFFAIESVINGLQMAQVEAIGPFSIREVLLRIKRDERCDAKLALQYLDLLSAAEISIGTSTFCRMIVKVAQEGNSRLLYDIATCDQHPDVFDDCQLQESLLTQYQRNGDTRQANRTLAVLTFHEWGNPVPTMRMNVLLRAAFTREDDEETHALLATMIDQKCPVTRETRSHMFQRMVSNDQSPKSMAPRIYKLVVNVWKRLLTCGNDIDAGEWLQPLRLLGGIGKLEEYQELALWLVQWYSSSESRTSQTNTALSLIGQQYQPITKGKDSYHVLFPNTTAHAVIAWGFQSASIRKTQNPEGRTFKERVRSLAEHQSLWGLRFLVILRDLGVPVSTLTVSYACRMRLMRIFGPGKANWGPNVMAQKRCVAGMEEYVLAMEQIWGRDLFFRKLSVEQFCEELRNSAAHMWEDVQDRRLEKNKARAEGSGSQMSSSSIDTMN